MTFEPWISSLKHGNESWAEFSLHFSAPLQTFPFPISTSSVRHKLYLQSRKRNLSFSGGKQGKVSHGGRTGHVHWSYTFWLISLSLVSLLQPSLFALNFHWNQQKVSYNTLLFANSKLGTFKHFSLNVCSDCGKSRVLRKFQQNCFCYLKE